MILSFIPCYVLVYLELSSTFDVVSFYEQILSAWQSPNVGVVRLVRFRVLFRNFPQ